MSSASHKSLPALWRAGSLAAGGVPRLQSGVPLEARQRHWLLGLKLQADLTPPNHLQNAAFSFYQPRVFTPTVGGHVFRTTGDERHHSFTRDVTIHFGDVNHMQTTPELPPPTWYIRYDAKSIHRNKSNGWNFADDPLTVHTQTFDSLAAAIEFCRQEGFAFTVFPPRVRRFAHKSYADNFVWKGVPQPEDIDY